MAFLITSLPHMRSKLTMRGDMYFLNLYVNGRHVGVPPKGTNVSIQSSINFGETLFRITHE